VYSPGSSIADCWRGEGETRAGRTTRTEGMGGRKVGCELAGVVFPQGKHEHILARGLFRQIGDCCERKGSSDADATSTTISTLTNTTIRRSSIATAISTPHRGTTPRHKHIALPINERTRHYTEIRRGSGGRATEMNSHTDRRRKQGRKWQSGERERLKRSVARADSRW